MSITRGERPTELESRLHNFSALVALLTSVTAVALLAGWFLGIGWLVRPRPGFNPIRFNTAVALLASSIGLWLALEPKSKSRAVAGLGGFVLALASLTGLEYLFGWDLHIDQLFWNDAIVGPEAGPDGAGYSHLLHLCRTVSPLLRQRSQAAPLDANRGGLSG